MFPCRNFTGLRLCSSLQPMVLQGPNYFARITKPIWTCTFSQSRRVAQHPPSPTGLEKKKTNQTKTKTNTTNKPTHTPNHLGKQENLKNWSDTYGYRHTEKWISHPCVFVHSLSLVIFPLGYFIILTLALYSGFSYAPGVSTTHPFPSCSCHVVKSAYRWLAKACDLAAVHFSTFSSSSSLLIQITLNFITLLCIAWLPDPVVYG